MTAQTANSPKPADAPVEPVKTSITVNEQITAEAPAFISVLDDLAIEKQPGINLDDRLRSVPGFSLFRRTSSLVANPTTQGISLRGLGSSGASRTLILWDGIPINDPFGGWVYWTRVAPDEIDRVEISRGASTSLFGDRAMSGAISLFSHEPESRRFTANYSGGNLNTHELSGTGSHVFRHLGLSGALRGLTTDGYYIVPNTIRGSIDTRAGVRATAGDIKLDWLGSVHHLFVKFDALAEDRANGTSLTHNSTSLGNLSAQYSRGWQHEGVSVLAYHTREQYHSSFSSVTADRNTERLTYNQTVPSEATGAAAFWRHSSFRWNGVAGADMQRAEGYSTDRLVPSGIRLGGGTQLQHGTFLQGDVNIGPVRLFGGGRYQFTGGGRKFFSPSSGISTGRGPWRARVSAYRSFRAATLNELFREFRVGNIRTLPNDQLRPESLTGVEAGVDYFGETTRASVSLYRHQLDNLITNVTLPPQAGTIIRQRQNAQAALARGVDAEVHQRWRTFQLDGGYLYADSRFATGPRIPQVPKHQGNAQLTYSRPDTLISFGLRSYSFQFEDDINQFLLPGFAMLQLSARQHVASSLSAIATIENLLDRQFLVGYSPTPLIGQPRMWRIGLRWN